MLTRFVDSAGGDPYIYVFRNGYNGLNGKTYKQPHTKTNSHRDSLNGRRNSTENTSEVQEGVKIESDC